MIDTCEIELDFFKEEIDALLYGGDSSSANAGREILSDVRLQGSRYISMGSASTALSQIINQHNITHQ